MIAASEAFPVAWIPKEGSSVRREGYLYNNYPESSIVIETPEGNTTFDLGGFKTIGIVEYERGMRKDVALYANIALRYEIHKFVVKENDRNGAKVSLQDTSVDIEIGGKKQLLNIVGKNTNDVLTALLGVAPGSTYLSKKNLFSRNNAYLVSGISYGRSFFFKYNGFAEISIMDKIYFHYGLNEVIVNASLGLKSAEKHEVSVGILATTGNIPYMSSGLEHLHSSLNKNSQASEQTKAILDQELRKLLLPKLVRKKINLYFSNSYNISEGKQITLSVANEMPLRKGVWGIKLEFVIFK